MERDAGCECAGVHVRGLSLAHVDGVAVTGRACQHGGLARHVAAMCATLSLKNILGTRVGVHTYAVASMCSGSRPGAFW